MTFFKKSLFLLTIFIFGCDDFILERKNNESDLKLIVEKSQQFYKNIKKMRLDSINKMLNYYDIKPEIAQSTISKIHEGYGTLQGVEPQTASSNVRLRNGKMEFAEWNVVVNATYERAKFKETMTFKLVNDTIKVSGYFFELIP